MKNYKLLHVFDVKVPLHDATTDRVVDISVIADSTHEAELKASKIAREVYGYNYTVGEVSIVNYNLQAYYLLEHEKEDI